MAKKNKKSGKRAKAPVMDTGFYTDPACIDSYGCSWVNVNKPDNILFGGGDGTSNIIREKGTGEFMPGFISNGCSSNVWYVDAEGHVDNGCYRLMNAAYYTSLDKAISEGKTIEQFHKEIAEKSSHNYNPYVTYESLGLTPPWQKVPASLSATTEGDVGGEQGSKGINVYKIKRLL